MRICSFFPGGTELLYALGLGEAIVGVSHECDYPPAARMKPTVIRTVIDQERLSSEAIDATVRQAIERRMSLYTVDADALRRARPDLIVSQELCDVCAIDTAQVAEAVRVLPDRPRVLSLHPHTLEESLEEIRLVGEATGTQDAAERLLRGCRTRLVRVAALVAHERRRPKVFCLEWLNPLMASGHWVPEMVERAGGVEVLGQAGASSRSVEWGQVQAAAPEVLIVMPCGFSIARTRRELPELTTLPGWDTLPAVRDGQVYLVDGPSYFNRAGPRLVDGIELLAGLLHPERCAHLIPPGAVAML